MISCWNGCLVGSLSIQYAGCQQRGAKHRICVAPTALGIVFAVFPAFTRWANFCRAAGAGFVANGSGASAEQARCGAIRQFNVNCGRSKQRPYEPVQFSPWRAVDWEICIPKRCKCAHLKVAATNSTAATERGARVGRLSWRFRFAPRPEGLIAELRCSFRVRPLALCVLRRSNLVPWF